jgi:hypothetical protein
MYHWTSLTFHVDLAFLVHPVLSALPQVGYLIEYQVIFLFTLRADNMYIRLLVLNKKYNRPWHLAVFEYCQR